MKKIILVLSLISLGLVCKAQQKYWIYPKDKMTYSKLKAHAHQLGLHLINHSEWLNAYTAIIHEDKLLSIQNNHTILSIEPVNLQWKIMKRGHTFSLTDRALDQMNADTLLLLQWDAQNVKIGVIDAGFLGADKDPYLEKIIQEGQVMAYKNFIENNSDPYEGNFTNNSEHGTKVLRHIAGYKDGEYKGLATKAHYFLARTDEDNSEYKGEEDYWIAAMEWLHGMGVRLINSSLGYSTRYDNEAENYLPENVDGKSSALTRAVTIGIKEKGLTIVLSAGNEGNKPFKVICIPGDASGIITVGSTGYRYWDKLSFSSIGPKLLPEVKPLVACYGPGGTSYAAPVITGLLAVIKARFPHLNNNDFIELLQQSSHLYPYPNNYLGYGVPDVKRLLQLLQDTNIDFDRSEIIMAKNIYDISLSKSTNIVAFHKLDEYMVLSQERLTWREGKVTISKPEEACRTTVTNGEYVWEIIWSN